MKYFKYLAYIIRHKWFVFIAGMRIGCPLWRLLFHDLSKLYPSEFFAYCDYFYDEDKVNKTTLSAFAEFGCVEMAPWGYFEKDKFSIAWNYHQKRNPHHWQYWLLKNDDGDSFPVGMPMEYIQEMVADWAGAGKAITGKWEILEWYRKNKDKIIIRDEDRVIVEKLLSKVMEGVYDV